MHPWTGPPLTLAHPDISAEDVTMVVAALQSSVLSGGPWIDDFERTWAERFGTAHAIAVSSGTAALHLAVVAAGVQQDDYVITSPFSFVASANVILYERATPVFVDISRDSFTMDPAHAAEAARALPDGRLKALLPVHIFGQTAPMATLLDIGRQHGVPVIEDACEAIGAQSDCGPAGTAGHAGAFGFYPNKQMTCGEGGMLVTNDDEWARTCRSLRNQGRDLTTHWLTHDRLGFNYRLDEMSAALGLSQLQRLDMLHARRAQIAAAYTERLAHGDWLQCPEPTAGRTWFTYVVRVRPPADRDAVMKALARLGVPTRAYFTPIHLQPYYRARFGFREGAFPEAERAGREAMALPFHAHLTASQIDFVCDAVKRAVQDCRAA